MKTLQLLQDIQQGFIELINNDWMIQVFWAAVGYLVGKILEKVSKNINDRYIKRKIRKEMKQAESVATSELNVLSLDHADPAYKLHDIKIVNKNRQLYINCPDELKKKILKIDSDFIFHINTSFNSKNNFKDIEKSTGIPELTTLINKHRLVVAQEFLDELENHHTVFNGKKFGVYNINCKRKGETERSGFMIEVFETDYFTHRVFRSIYKELKETEHEITRVDKYNFLKYNPFITSFGINTYAIVDGEKGKSIVFAKRSKFISNSNGKNFWHVSMNEGLSQTDYDQEDISLVQCFYRGLREELGIREEERDFIEEFHFYDLFLEKNNFEIGITSLVELHLNSIEMLKKYKIAKDSTLETDEIKIIPFNKKDLAIFIKKNKLEFSPAGLFTLRMVCARELK